MGAEALIIGTGISAIGSLKAASDQASALEVQARSRLIAARQAEAAGLREAEVLERKGKRIMGAQVSAFGRSGVTLEGSPLLMLEETAANISEEISARLASARFRASTLRAEGEMDFERAGQVRTSGFLQAGATIISGFGRRSLIEDRPSIVDVGIQEEEE